MARLTPRSRTLAKYRMEWPNNDDYARTATDNDYDDADDVTYCGAFGIRRWQKAVHSVPIHRRPTNLLGVIFCMINCLGEKFPQNPIVFKSANDFTTLLKPHSHQQTKDGLQEENNQLMLTRPKLSSHHAGHFCVARIASFFCISKPCDQAQQTFRNICLRSKEDGWMETMAAGTICSFSLH